MGFLYYSVLLLMSGFHWNGISGQLSLWQNRMERRSHCGTLTKWVGGVKLGITQVPTHTVNIRSVYIYFKNLSHTSQKKLSNVITKNWLILWREIIAVYFKKLSKQINTTCTKKRRYFIHKWVAYTANSGLWKCGINMCLCSEVYWVAAAKCGLWINGIKKNWCCKGQTDRQTACRWVIKGI